MSHLTCRERTRVVLSRVLATLGVAVWSFLAMSAALGTIAYSPGANSPWLIAIGVGVVAPILLLTQINRAISFYEDRGQAVPGTADKEQELLDALRNRGELTPAIAAMRTSLTVEEAARILDRLAGKGHLKVLSHDGALSYSFFDRDRIERPEQGDGLEAQKLSSGAPPVPVANGSLNGEPQGVVEPLAEPLSERELEVLTLLASGRTNREIGRDLFVAVGTVKSHTSNIYGKLEARNRAEAIAKARSLKLV
jgi:ATP/maltotriose-dependent transcriptional regulator MalT